MRLLEKHRLRVPGKEVSEAMAKPARAPLGGGAFLHLPGFDENAFQAASRILPIYSSAGNKTSSFKKSRGSFLGEVRFP